MLCVKTCKNCIEAGKNLKPNKLQTQYGKLPSVESVYGEISIDLARPRCQLIVKVAGRRQLFYVNQPPPRSLYSWINLLALFVAPKRKKVYPRTPFMSEEIRHFGQERFIELIEWPFGDHRGNRKIERCIRTKTERMRTNKHFEFEKYNTGLSKVLFETRTPRRKKSASRAEQPMGRKNITLGDLLKPSFASFSEQDPKFQLALDEFPHDAHSTIILRERAHGSKLESAFRKQR